MKIRFQTLSAEFSGELNDTPAARELIKNLPVSSRVSTWGDEIYFDTGVAAPDTGATMKPAVGEIGYWPPGRCLCVFFGPTPASDSEDPVPASPVVVVGKTSASPELLRGIAAGEEITVSAAPEPA